jgi:hypothetical protein
MQGSDSIYFTVIETTEISFECPITKVFSCQLIFIQFIILIYFHYSDFQLSFIEILGFLRQAHRFDRIIVSLVSGRDKHDLGSKYYL